MDNSTDAAIQQVVRQEFPQATILVVTHRLTTIADFDAVLVLGDGKVVEFGPLPWRPSRGQDGENSFQF